MNIVHITLDEKFVNSANNQFSTIHYTSTFYILLPQKKKKLKYVEKRNNVVIVHSSLYNLYKLATTIENSLIIFHGLSFKAAFIKRFCKKQNIFLWMLWGSEFFSNTAIFKDQSVFYDKLTLKLQNEIDHQQNKTFLNSFYKHLNLVKHKFALNSILQMDFVGLPFEEQLTELNQKTNKIFKPINFMYYPIDLVIHNSIEEINTKNILVGNSASATNNHLEVFEILNKIKQSDRSIICPLSYGDKIYREKIIKSGNEIFDQKFIPLVDFLPLHEYNAIIKSCSIAIMNHKRQQAFGNIISLIYQGTKVFLHNQNPIYLYLKRISVVVFSIEDDLQCDDETIFDELLLSVKVNNKKLIFDSFNISTLNESLSKSLELIKKENGY